ncbi:IS110 family transposase [Pseudomonas cedrina]|uniref:IS110 family transposase n=1 Tax=Pseudomonas cedrina TaxID=651740 RepID=UPI0027853DDE|nr:IS110 family transposase [Pseudomonas cedrina]MDQ0651293.1 transposase [Pseudomonas cedrina]MDQ0651355.1 transposase [Pseudomonas cedrina]MDQ0651593.1 transposase [Pseudomonas cedrina]MDQ0653409.1 transposase [Pseudomonas cedrina]MDQ0653870.1 transposase [Pseudomonas cedrina]
MAMQANQFIVGIDVAKAELVIHFQSSGTQMSLSNSKPEIKKWLKQQPANTALCIEATNVYHLDIVEMAHEKGFNVYVVDGFQLSNYRKSIGGRSKTDASDAALLARYLEREGSELRAWTPPPAVYGKLQSLLRRRAALVTMRASLNQSWKNESLLKAAFKSFTQQMDKLDLLVQKKLKDLLKEAGLLEQVARCQAIEGIGFLTATALVMAFIRGEFKTSDAYIAFLGMDLRVFDSGEKTGRRRLTKRGCSEIRRLLHNAAMSASRSAAWKETYEHYRNKGKATTEALVILSRKLARIAFALMKAKTNYVSKTA